MPRPDGAPPVASGVDSAAGQLPGEEPPRLDGGLTAASDDAPATRQLPGEEQPQPGGGSPVASGGSSAAGRPQGAETSLASLSAVQQAETVTTSEGVVPERWSGEAESTVPVGTAFRPRLLALKVL